MSLLDAFQAMWSGARRTFGEGTPEGGAQFDASVKLRQLQSEVESAAPGDMWSGEATDAYAVVNHDHAQVLGKLADLDVRLGAEVDRSAEVVSNGRMQLDNIRNSVVSVASALPDTQANYPTLLRIVSVGLARVRRTMLTADAELAAIAERIKIIDAGYAALSNQKFATRREPHPQDLSDVTGDQDSAPGMDDVAAWHVEWNMLAREVSAHNASLAAHMRLRPPSTNHLALAAWNARLAQLNANAERLYLEQVQKAAEAVQLGIPEPTVSPPVIVEDESQIPGSLFSSPGDTTASRRPERPN